MSDRNKNELMENKLSTPDILKLENKKYKRKNVALFSSFITLAILFIAFFIVCIIGVLDNALEFRIILLLELVSAFVFTVFLILFVIFLVKYITFKKYVEKDKLKNFRSYDI